MYIMIHIIIVHTNDKPPQPTKATAQAIAVSTPSLSHFSVDYTSLSPTDYQNNLIQDPAAERKKEPK